MEDEKPRNTKPLPSQAGWMERLATPRGMIALAVGSIAMIAMAAFGAWFILNAFGATSIDPKLSAPPSLEDLATEYPELGSILLDAKLDSAYKDFLLVFQEEGADAAYELARKRGLLNDRDELRLTLVLDTEDTTKLEAELEAQGIKVTAVGGELMDIAIPLEILMGIMASGEVNEFLAGITELEHVVRVRVPLTSTPRTGGMGVESLATIESLAKIGASDWHAAGYTGEGVTLAVLDGGFDGYKSLLGSDLPADPVVRSFVSGYEIDELGSPHGAACAEIIHDIAPNAKLYLVAAQTWAETFQAVDWLLTQDIDIISHSMGTSVGPRDGSDSKARMVDRVVQSGVLWVNAAGNEADVHYRGAFTDADEDGFHEFSPGDEFIGFAPLPDRPLKIILNWDDWTVGNQDFDLFILDADGNEVASSTNVQSGPDDSIEFIQYEFPDSGPYLAAFYGENITRPITFDFFLEGAEIEYIEPGYSLSSPADARLSLSVGAVHWNDDILEEYSSQGPTNDGRLKPEISAPSVVDVSSYSKPFNGTSAATPHVAGAAALLLEAFPQMSPQEISQYFIERAVDLGPTGPDYGYGQGRLWMDAPPGFEAPAPTEEQPTPTEEQPAQAPTQAATSTNPPPTAILTRRPTLTPISGSGGTSSSSVSGLILLACVVLPGLLGVGGIGLLGGVWYWNRSRPASRRPRPAQRQAAYPVAPPAAPGARGPVRAQSKDLCPRCGAPHRMEAKFCPKCGLSLRWGMPDAQPELSCKKCGAALRPNSNFCLRCGQRQ